MLIGCAPCTMQGCAPCTMQGCAPCTMQGWHHALCRAGTMHYVGLCTMHYVGLCSMHYVGLCSMHYVGLGTSFFNRFVPFQNEGLQLDGSILVPFFNRSALVLFRPVPFHSVPFHSQSKNNHLNPFCSWCSQFKNGSIQRSVLSQRTVPSNVPFLVKERFNPTFHSQSRRLEGGGGPGGVYCRGVQDKSFVEKRLLKSKKMTIL